MTVFGQPSDWAQFGLAGLVIFALFLTLFLLGRLAIAQWQRSDTEKNKFLISVIEQQAAERMAWKEEIQTARAEHIAALREMATETAEAIRQGHNDSMMVIRDNTAALHALQQQVSYVRK